MKDRYKILFVLSLVLLQYSCKNGNTEKVRESTNSSQEISDAQILDSIQYYTFQYFWEGAEPNSGMARERIHMDGLYPQNDKHIITSGGSGFGLMAIVVGIEREFISREDGLLRFEKIMDFLESADRFHGACPHWWNGETGKVKAFSKKDNGGDIVETAYLVQGLFTLKQFLNTNSPKENKLIVRISEFIEEIEWDWYEKNDVLLWHWSPEYGFEMNLEIRGYNECLITYVLAASSRKHSIQEETYHKGWARNGEIRGEHSNYGYTLNLNHNGSKDFGGPLFWAHYSYLGLDPRNLSDKYASYWNENVNHTMINYKYCIENPMKHEGYGENCWGLTASYTINRRALEANLTERKDLANKLLPSYTAHSPINDPGVISPTAALSSFPYAPNEAMKAAKHFYNDLGDKLMGPYGPYDAFNIEYEWFPQRYLAIDQGPIVVMIENHRTGLPWKLFMKNPEIKAGLEKLGFKIN